jgi:hypothetical protein
LKDAEHREIRDPEGWSCTDNQIYGSRKSELLHGPLELTQSRTFHDMEAFAITARMGRFNSVS